MMTKQSVTLPGRSHLYLRMTRGFVMITVLIAVIALSAYAVFEQSLSIIPDPAHPFRYQINFKDRIHYVTANQYFWLSISESVISFMIVAATLIGIVAEWLARNGPRRLR